MPTNSADDLKKVFAAFDKLKAFYPESDIIKISDQSFRFRAVTIEDEVKAHNMAKAYASKFSEDPTAYLYRLKIEIIAHALSEINGIKIIDYTDEQKEAIASYFRELASKEVGESVIHFLFMKYNDYITSIEKKYNIFTPEIPEEKEIKKEEKSDKDYEVVDVPDESKVKSKEEIEERNKKLEEKIETKVDEDGKIMMYEKK